jgi:hypothetical protein
VTTTLLTVIPLELTDTVELEAKLFPVRVTGTVVPWAPLLGMMDVRVGAGLVTVNGRALLTPLVVVTITLADPVDAVAEIVNVSVI